MEQICNYKAITLTQFTTNGNIQYHASASVLKFKKMKLERVCRSNRQTISTSHLRLSASLPPRRFLSNCTSPIRPTNPERQPHLLISFPQPETAEAPEKQVSHHVSESWRISLLV